MAKGLPFYKMYVADAETDENFRMLEDAELGFYWRCLNHSWVNDGLPADPEIRSRVLRTPREIADRLWVMVNKCFVLSGDGSRYLNLRQERERAEAVSKSEVNAKSAKTRYERTANAGANAVRTQSERSSNAAIRASESVSESKSLTLVKKEIALSPGGIEQASFERFRTLFESTGKPTNENDWLECGQVLAAMQDVTDEILCGDVIPFLADQAERLKEQCRRDDSKVSRPGNWIKQRPWERRARARASPEQKTNPAHLTYVDPFAGMKPEAQPHE